MGSPVWDTGVVARQEQHLLNICTTLLRDITNVSVTGIPTKSYERNGQPYICWPLFCCIHWECDLFLVDNWTCNEVSIGKSLEVNDKSNGSNLRRNAWYIRRFRCRSLIIFMIHTRICFTKYLNRVISNVFRRSATNKTGFIVPLSSD